MGVYKNRSGSVGRPFTKGNPGGGRPKRAQNNRRNRWASRVSALGAEFCGCGELSSAVDARPSQDLSGSQVIDGRVIIALR